ncbi:lipopolysaccharide assembly protein LapA domain-containing protein [Rhizobium oryzicola]|uniref:DUF1049 domain-containing protein n=1 Tax=Rhizobium oryzicola TaxID=1232668 RepID=A0ABT8SQT2_9HYPH|nr:lipopolysaccharide assembly protein LapA domain-containing protein [Rhizobium oryzicola]MDO1580798.1 DUF1049 domain-containing protein [Rhizobium oryzicola]
MERIKKIIGMVILVPLAIILVVLCVANRQSVTLALNPFNPSDTVLSLTGPLFLLLFVALLFGMVIGSVATWFAQGKYRRQARIEAREALKRQASEPQSTASSTALISRHG